MGQLSVDLSIWGTKTFLELFERYVKAIEKQTELMSNSLSETVKKEVEE